MTKTNNNRSKLKLKTLWEYQKEKRPTIIAMHRPIGNFLKPVYEGKNGPIIIYAPETSLEPEDKGVLYDLTDSSGGLRIIRFFDRVYYEIESKYKFNLENLYLELGYKPASLEAGMVFTRRFAEEDKLRGKITLISCGCNREIKEVIASSIVAPLILARCDSEDYNEGIYGVLNKIIESKLATKPKNGPQTK